MSLCNLPFSFFSSFFVFISPPFFSVVFFSFYGISDAYYELFSNMIAKKILMVFNITLLLVIVLNFKM